MLHKVSKFLFLFRITLFPLEDKIELGTRNMIVLHVYSLREMQCFALDESTTHTSDKRDHPPAQFFVVLFRARPRAHNTAIIMSTDVEMRIQGACRRSQRWKRKSDPAVTLDVQTGLTTPPKSHYSLVVSCCQVQFVLLAKARRTTRASCWLWQMSSDHVRTKKKGRKIVWRRCVVSSKISADINQIV